MSTRARLRDDLIDFGEWLDANPQHDGGIPEAVEAYLASLFDEVIFLVDGENGPTSWWAWIPGRNSWHCIGNPDNVNEDFLTELKSAQGQKITGSVFKGFDDGIVGIAQAFDGITS